MNWLQRVQSALVSRIGKAGRRRAPFSPTTWRLVLLLLGLVGLAYLVLGDRGLLDHARLRRTLDSLETHSRSLETQIDWYRDRNQRLQADDPFTLEEEARRMGMARPGEEVYRIVLPEDTVTRKGR